MTTTYGAAIRSKPGDQDKRRKRVDAHIRRPTDELAATDEPYDDDASGSGDSDPDDTGESPPADAVPEKPGGDATTRPRSASDIFTAVADDAISRGMKGTLGVYRQGGPRIANETVSSAELQLAPEERAAYAQSMDREMAARDDADRLMASAEDEFQHGERVDVPGVDGRLPGAAEVAETDRRLADLRAKKDTDVARRRAEMQQSVEDGLNEKISEVRSRMPESGNMWAGKNFGESVMQGLLLAFSSIAAGASGDPSHAMQWIYDEANKNVERAKRELATLEGQAAHEGTLAKEMWDRFDTAEQAAEAYRLAQYEMIDAELERQAKRLQGPALARLREAQNEVARRQYIESLGRFRAASDESVERKIIHERGGVVGGSRGGIPGAVAELKKEFPGMKDTDALAVIRERMGASGGSSPTLANLGASGESGERRVDRRLDYMVTLPPSMGGGQKFVHKDVRKEAEDNLFHADILLKSTDRLDHLERTGTPATPGTDANTEAEAIVTDMTYSLGKIYGAQALSKDEERLIGNVAARAVVELATTKKSGVAVKALRDIVRRKIQGITGRLYNDFDEKAGVLFNPYTGAPSGATIPRD